MGFKKGLVSLARFRTPQEQLDLDSVGEKLKSRAFSDFFPLEAKERWGWTLIDDPLSSNFTLPQYKFGSYLIFTLRVDERRIPSSLLNLRCLEEEKKFLSEQGLKKISREQKQSIREGAKRELALKIPPVPSFYEVCWSWQTGTVYFSGTSPKVRDDFVSYFEDTFEMPLNPFCPAQDPIENRQFLTWLWAKAKEREGTIAVSRGREVRLEFLKRVMLESGEGEYVESVVCQGHHAGFYEVEEALRQGKKIKEARLNLQEDRDEWEFTLKADDFVLQGLRLSNMKDDEEEKEANYASLLDRVSLMERLLMLLDDLFSLFKKEAKI
ncbi:MAG: recombination-associated protein RdgC [Syntrophales bacterium]|nr:recombination-associated protein RdgC [Syntrophales bacterium]